MAEPRIASLTRNTKETQITMELAIDGNGVSEIETGIPFLDHMLTLFARHGFFDLQLKATGDIDVDYHHTVEDTGIVLGQVVELLEADVLERLRTALVRTSLVIPTLPVTVGLAVHVAGTHVRLQRRTQCIDVPPR